MTAQKDKALRKVTKNILKRTKQGTYFELCKIMNNREWKFKAIFSLNRQHIMHELCIVKSAFRTVREEQSKLEGI